MRHQVRLYYPPRVCIYYTSITPLRPPVQLLHRNVGPSSYMSQGSGSSGGGGNDRDRFHRGGKSIMMRDNGRGPPLSKDYRQLLSPGDQREESRAAESGGGGGGSRSHKNISYRREGEGEERESRGRTYVDYKGKREKLASGLEALLFGSRACPISFLCTRFPYHPSSLCTRQAAIENGAQAGNGLASALIGPPGPLQFRLPLPGRVSGSRMPETARRPPQPPRLIISIPRQRGASRCTLCIALSVFTICPCFLDPDE